MSVNDIAKKVAAVYDRIGFLSRKNEHLEEDILDYHGFTMGKMWKILRGLNKKWEKNNLTYYKEFDYIGKKAYDKNKDEIDDFMKRLKELYILEIEHLHFEKEV